MTMLTMLLMLMKDKDLSIAISISGLEAFPAEPVDLLVALGGSVSNLPMKSHVIQSYWSNFY